MEQSLAESRSIRLSFRSIRISFRVGTNCFVHGLMETDSPLSIADREKLATLLFPDAEQRPRLASLEERYPPRTSAMSTWCLELASAGLERVLTYTR
jgi:hypothetical protein